jgi:phosphatidylserine/phosphatidylglycerophosphate/cardiolipin synthase-like enzyme
MGKVKARSYLSPTLVLLAFDWSDGEAIAKDPEKNDFLGFAVLRRPGFRNEQESWLPNRLGFEGPAEEGKDLPSDRNPIQKFLWWDARINTADRGKTFNYTVTPVRGTPDAPRLVESAAKMLEVTIPTEVEHKIGTFFNRAVVSSQAFIKAFGDKPAGEKLERALAWLANGMEAVIPSFIAGSPAVDGAIYHLSDDHWVVPALAEYGGPASFVYHSKDGASDAAVEELGRRTNLSFVPRTRGNLMHNKFLVRRRNGQSEAVLTGSANFTTKGLTSQANLLHTWDSPELAELFQKRQELLAENPTPKEAKGKAGWSDEVEVGDARVRVFFAPEPDDGRLALDEVVGAVGKARQSVIFCLFSSTDEPLRNACFEAGDKGKMMFGLINRIGKPKPDAADNASTRTTVAVYHRSKENRDVYSYDLFRRGKQPPGFWWEVGSIRTAVRKEADDEPLEEEGRKQPPEVYIHHKFLVIDAETDNPVIYTGSANFSNNSNYKNDENLLEIRSCPRLARIYLAEFLRLYEHYRARAQFNERAVEHRAAPRLREKTSEWAGKHYRKGTPEYRARLNMVKE